MSTSSKIIVGTILGAGVLAAVGYFKDVQQAQAKLEVIPTINIHKLALDGLTIRIDALLKNPSSIGFSMKYPFVKLLHKDTTLGTSQAIDKDIRIPAYGQVMIKDIMVTIPVLSFFSVTYDIIKALLNGQSIAMTVSVTTRVNLGWKEVDYENKQDLTIKK